jgi:hypothetical protein
LQGFQSLKLLRFIANEKWQDHVWAKEWDPANLTSLLKEVGFLRPTISRYILPIGAWTDGPEPLTDGPEPWTDGPEPWNDGSEPLTGLLPGELAEESFLKYIKSSVRLIQENTGFTRKEVMAFIHRVERDLISLAESNEDFFAVKLYVSP